MNHTPSPPQLLHNIPGWVYALFLLLLWMGLRQLAPGRPHWRRAVLVPAAMAALSAFGALTALGGMPMASGVWALSAGMAFVLVFSRRLPEGVRYQAAEQRFIVPGSAVPLALMMGVFITKFAAGMALALHPALRHDTGTLMLLGLLYGAFSGIFAGRAGRLIVLARREQLSPAR